jgi:hypothetical protein
MRSSGSFHPEWGYLAPRPSFLRTCRIVLVSTAVGLAAGAAVAVSLVDHPAAERSVMVEPSVTDAAQATPLPAARISPVPAPNSPALTPAGPQPAIDAQGAEAVPAPPPNPAPSAPSAPVTTAGLPAAPLAPAATAESSMQDAGSATVPTPAERPAAPVHVAHARKKPANNLVDRRQDYFPDDRNARNYQNYQSYYDYDPRPADTFAPSPYSRQW